jgi:DNA-binding CsgD family transcriptional regulator
MVLLRAWRDSEPPEYPASLLDPRTCSQVLISYLYANLPPTPPIDRTLRDTQIYQRYVEGETTAELAKALGLSVQRIRGIIRHMSRRK